MAFDGLTTNLVAKELNDLLTDGRIDKVLQPEKDEIHLVVRAKGNNNKLILSASANNPRIHLTEYSKENPIKAPMFCMLLRKHILSGKILKIYQPNMERVIFINLECKNEMGDTVEKNLIIEIMGRTSNIILTDENNKILGSNKYVDFSVSQKRPLLPGMIYELPPSQNKENPFYETLEGIQNKVNNFNGLCSDFILNNYIGIGPMSSREIAFSLYNDESYIIDDNNKEDFCVRFIDYFKNIEYKPCLLIKKGKYFDFSPIDINQYQDGIIKEAYSSLNKALDEFCYKKDKIERINQKTASLNKFIENNIQRCKKKIAIQKQKLKDCENKEADKIKGDLLISNLYLIEENSDFVVVQNYYDNMKEIKISLTPELNPSQNAQRYYTKYQKSKNAELMTNIQLDLSNKELEYLLSVQESIMLCESENDIKEIENELVEQGYKIKQNTKKNEKSKRIVSKPMEFTLSDGHILYVGKNNYQNDELTLRMSKNNDLWFHTKAIHGSHAVISVGANVPNDDVIVEAAKICAYYSKARNSANVPVDYTEIRNVKKPSGAKPGMVIYVKYKTVNVTPSL